ncbi:hypothetical protein MG293_011134 [Ovis ammon polii]|uniref:Smr domain-containing protein n=1 Tax=Ovis ammon polii TaxID=230172 RepID=A0AAD4U5W2_OVIAM|nr:hypothetical protein MG293_011134 [Ovis ammon polii]KAI4565286.1 hypothetical protein MJT46_009629 [Ovis ammon polii x Ovis aries]
MECYSKAKEAYRIGKKDVATFYAQQGSLHEQKMKEANHLAAVEIFEKVNASLLPQKVLDLHGLHVDEAIEHLMTVLQQKTEEFKQKSGKSYLSVITGRGNHSQGAVTCIKPAVIKHLTSHNFRFSEIKPGCLKVMLKYKKHPKKCEHFSLKLALYTVICQFYINVCFISSDVQL